MTWSRQPPPPPASCAWARHIGTADVPLSIGIVEHGALRNRISTSITWYHGHGDTTAPMTAARRVVDRLPTARMVEIEDAEHAALFDRMGRVLDELLSRGPE